MNILKRLLIVYEKMQITRLLNKVLKVFLILSLWLLSVVTINWKLAVVFLDFETLHQERTPLFATARILRGAGSMKWYGVCLSVPCLSVLARANRLLWAGVIRWIDAAVAGEYGHIVSVRRKPNTDFVSCTWLYTGACMRILHRTLIVILSVHDDCNDLDKFVWKKRNKSKKLCELFCRYVKWKNLTNLLAICRLSSKPCWSVHISREQVQGRWMGGWEWCSSSHVSIWLASEHV